MWLKQFEVVKNYLNIFQLMYCLAFFNLKNYCSKSYHIQRFRAIK